MRKQNKSRIKQGTILGAALFIAMGTAMTAQAATGGWRQENGSWSYYDGNSRVTDQWKKSDNNFWFYLNSSGIMERNAMIDGKYVNEDGAMITNAWRKIYEDGEDNWYYFTSSGKRIEDGWKSINGKKYHFNDEGAMEYGWFDDNKYYLGSQDDGSMTKGWARIQGPEDSELSNEEYDFYFDSNGVIVKDKLSRKIGKYTYAFDEEGRMLYGWVDTVNKVMDDDDNASGDIKNYRFFKNDVIKSGVDGSRLSGWKQMDPPEGIRSDSDDTSWFYFKDGAPYAAEDGSDYIIKTVNSKKYCFNELGEMQSGFKRLTESGSNVGSFSNYSSDETFLYYFGTNKDGYMRTGSMVLYNEDDGEKHNYYFLSNGKGVTGIKDSCVYVMGKRLDADKDLKYQVVTDGTDIRLVNSSGKIQKPSSGTKEYKDSDDRKFVVDSSGEVISMPDGYKIKDK